MLRHLRGSSTALRLADDPWALRGDFSVAGYVAMPVTLYADLVSVLAGVIWMGAFDGTRGGYLCEDFDISSRVPPELSLGADFSVIPTVVFVEDFVPPGVIALSLSTDWSIASMRIFANAGIAGILPDNLSLGTDWTDDPTQVFAVAGIP